MACKGRVALTTLLTAAMSHMWSASRVHTSSCPQWAAACSGVQPSMSLLSTFTPVCNSTLHEERTPDQSRSTLKQDKSPQVGLWRFSLQDFDVTFGSGDMQSRCLGVRVRPQDAAALLHRQGILEHDPLLFFSSFVYVYTWETCVRQKKRNKTLTHF